MADRRLQRVREFLRGSRSASYRRPGVQRAVTAMRDRARRERGTGRVLPRG